MSKQRKVLRPAKRGKIPLSAIKKAVKEVSEQRKECDEVKVKATEEIVPEAELKRRDLAEKRIEQEKKDVIERANREAVKAKAEQRTKLLARLGQLTYDRARHEAALRDIVAESNKIGEILQKTEGNG